MEKRSDIRQLKGIGEKTAAQYRKLGVETIDQLLSYYPRAYEKIGTIIPAAKAQNGQVCAVRAVVLKTVSEMPRTGGRKLSVLNVMVRDEETVFFLTFFNMPFLKNTLKAGTFYVFRGLFRDKGAKRIMEQPKIYKAEEFELVADSLQPVYALTEGIGNQQIRKAMGQALSQTKEREDYLPDEVKKRYFLEDLAFSLKQIHFPESEQSLTAARKRLVFDEFLIFMIELRRMKAQNEILYNQTPIREIKETKLLLKGLPYQLTGAQKRVWEEMKKDLDGERMMNRLIQGDVGSGKTIVAFLALLMCAENGYQGALMAPTEVLAKQHYEQVLQLTQQHGLCFKPVLLTGSVTQSERKAIYKAIESGEANFIIGTHALIQEKVNYQNLGLVVTDEQHRFGVRQRESFAHKGERVHVLVMSATPIPRTLAIILYGDLNISIIDELPADRLPIKNCVVNTDYRRKAYSFMEQEVRAGRQVYVICPMVEEGELENVENVLDYTDKLNQQFPEDIRIASLYGTMKPAEKNRIMEEFAAHHIDILVSTTVIEVGINVPNATVMLVENAERFGLAQLHQLRGRVGRGKHQSYCIFINGTENEKTTERLEILNRSNDGFYIAGEDLKLRGPGDFFGIRQSGIMNFKLGDVFHDAELLKEAGECAAEVLEDTKINGIYSRLWNYLRIKERNHVDFRSL